MPDWKRAAYRRQLQSPVGAEEYVDASQVDPNSLATTYGNKIYYASEGAAQDPSTQAHERIHAGQNRLAIQPSLEQVQRALSPYPGVADYGAEGTKSYEMPAYAFQAYLKSQSPRAQEFNNQIRSAYQNYINLIKSQNDNAYNIEAAVPEELEKAYLKTPGAVPIARSRNPITGH